MFHVFPVPCLADNYAWVLFAHPSSAPPQAAMADCVVIDPGEAAPIAAALAARRLRLRSIWLTHHHHDHTGGVAELMAPGVEVVGASIDRHRLPPVDRAVSDLSRWQVAAADGGEKAEVVALHVPGHTRGAMAFYLAAAGALWTGDTLFSAGCGRLMEGSAAQMHAALARIAALPPATRLFCGHEYTARNLAFAASILPEDDATLAALQRTTHLRASGLPTLPTTLAAEKQTSLFLRAAEPGVRAALGTGPEPLEAFAELRRRRDAF